MRYCGFIQGPWVLAKISLKSKEDGWPRQALLHDILILLWLLLLLLTLLMCLLLFTGVMKDAVGNYGVLFYLGGSVQLTGVTTLTVMLIIRKYCIDTQPNLPTGVS